MPVRRAWVFAGGEFALNHLPQREVDEQDLIVCVDGGLQHCLQLGLRPHMLVGDMDSVSHELLQDDRIRNVKRYVYPSDKSASDLELSLTILSTEPVDEVILMGVSGGRTDHMLFNWQLVRLCQWPFAIQFIDETTRSYVLNADKREVAIETDPGIVVSLLPMESCTGVETSGLQYPLSNAVIDSGSTLGLSNVVNSEQVRVSIANGSLLVMVQRTNQGGK